MFSLWNESPAHFSKGTAHISEQKLRIKPPWTPQQRSLWTENRQTPTSPGTDRPFSWGCQARLLPSAWVKVTSGPMSGLSGDTGREGGLEGRWWHPWCPLALHAVRPSRDEGTASLMRGAEREEAQRGEAPPLHCAEESDVVLRGDARGRLFSHVIADNLLPVTRAQCGIYLCGNAERLLSGSPGNSAIDQLICQALADTNHCLG